MKHRSQYNLASILRAIAATRLLMLCCLGAACVALSWRPSIASGRLRTISVRSYGAHGDGHSDDTDSITRATADGARGAVYFPAGIYILTRPVNLPVAPIRIFGDGSKSVIMQKSDNLGIFNILPGSRGIEVDHLHFRETGTVHGNQLGRGALYINPGGQPPGVSNVLVHDNVFDCASTSCISATYLVNSGIQRNIFDNDGTGEHGVYLSSDRDYYSRDVMVSSNYFHSSYSGKLGQDGIELAIQLRATKHVIILNNHMRGWSDGILTIPEVTKFGSQPNVSGLIIRGNTIDSPADDGFVAFGGALKYAIVEGNTFNSCGQNGIRSDGPLEQSVFERNKILDSGEAGIRLNFVAHSIFSDNVIQDSGRAARGGPDSRSGIRLNRNNLDNLFIGNTSNISSGARLQTFGLSLGGSDGQDAGNWHNCFESNHLTPNVRGDVDANKLESDCNSMQDPPQIHVANGGSKAYPTPQLRITNRNRVPLRILSITATGPGGFSNQTCGELLAAGSACDVGIAAQPGHRTTPGRTTVVYEVGEAVRTVTLPLTVGAL